MKKLFITIVIFTVTLLMVGCNQNNVEKLYLDSMGTTIYVEIDFRNNKTNKNKVINEIKDIFNFYSQISSSYKRNEVFEGSPYYNYENIYSINLNAGIKPVEVVDELIELVELGIILNEQTNGYFNIGIGHLVDLWKEPLKDFYLVYEEDNYDILLQNALQLEEIDLSKVVINKEEKTIYLTDNSIKLELGALSKGYALNKVVKLLKEHNILYYAVNAGNSSIAFGVKSNNDPYRLGLNDPHKKYEHNYIGILEATHTTLTTSGSSEQSLTVVGKNGKIPEKLIHHIISPFSKKPENYYHSISIIGDDAGLMDAYSTAVFLMDVNTAIQFLEDNNIGYVLYLRDFTVVTNLDEEIFTLQPLA